LKGHSLIQWKRRLVDEVVGVGPHVRERAVGPLRLVLEP
jgi:hypothetical protein